MTQPELLGYLLGAFFLPWGALFKLQLMIKAAYAAGE